MEATTLVTRADLSRIVGPVLQAFSAAILAPAIAALRARHRESAAASG